MPCRRNSCGIPLGSLLWEGERKRGALIGDGLSLHTTAMPLDQSFHDGEADAVAGKFARGMKFLEHLKKAVGVLRIETDSAIGNRKPRGIRLD